MTKEVEILKSQYDFLKKNNPARALIKDAAKRTKSSEATVYGWIQGKSTPSAIKLDALQKYLRTKMESEQ